jgi:hypothetical protein
MFCQHVFEFLKEKKCSAELDLSVDFMVFLEEVFSFKNSYVSPIFKRKKVTSKMRLIG